VIDGLVRKPAREVFGYAAGWGSSRARAASRGADEPELTPPGEPPFC
jgi:hypothetical protein